MSAYELYVLIVFYEIVSKLQIDIYFTYIEFSFDFFDVFPSSCCRSELSLLTDCYRNNNHHTSPKSRYVIFTL